LDLLSSFNFLPFPPFWMLGINVGHRLGARAPRMGMDIRLKGAS
jgi:hypothetical protein